MKKLDLQDLALRALIVAAGSIAAILLALHGQSQSLLPLSVGATLGALMMGRSGATEE